MRLIDADALLEGRQDHEQISTHLIWNAPTIDAVPIVRCRNCKHAEVFTPIHMWCNKFDRAMEYKWFCSRGERMKK